MRVFFVILLYLIPQFISGNSIQQQRSALWIVRDGLTSQSDIDKIVSIAGKLNITDIFFQIRALGYTYYNSQLEKKSSSIESEFDPLQYILLKSSHTGIRIHAWVNMFYIWAKNKFPENIDHILNKRAEYVLRNGAYPDYKTLRKNGHEGFFLDPKAYDVQNDLLQILIELAENYQIAGIHLDYYRYPSLSYSFSPASRTLYMLDQYYDPWDIYNSVENYSKQRGYKVFLQADKDYKNSLRQTLSDYLKIISESIKKINPLLELSVAVKPDPVEAKHRYFQDWISWLENNYCDFVVLMNYRTVWEEFERVLNQLNDDEIKRKIIVGVSTYNQDVYAVIRRLDTIYDGGYAGYALFSYNYLNRNSDYLQTLEQLFFARR